MATWWLMVPIIGSGLGSALASGVVVQVKDAAGVAVPEAVVVVEATSTAASLAARAASAGPLTATVDQHNLRFVPEISVVRTGTAIDFPNGDRVQHQVYSFSPAKTFKLSLYAGHVYPPVLFDTPGIVTLGCNIHDAMLGFIYVTDSPWFGKTDAQGRFEAQRLAAGSYRVVIWHPRFNEATAELETQVTVPADGNASVTQTLAKPMKPAPSDNSARQWKGY